MPEAPQYLRDEFPDADGDAWLYSRGFKLNRRWEWVPPSGHEFVQRDWDAIDYMIMEWDFGGLAGEQD